MITATPAIVPTQVTCEDCSKEIKPGARASCLRCVRTAISEAEEDAFAEGEEEGADKPAESIREWADRRFILGQISSQVRAELDLCADDIETNHG